MWTARKFDIYVFIDFETLHSVVDPRISRLKLRDDAEGDVELLHLIDEARASHERRFAARLPSTATKEFKRHSNVITKCPSSFYS